MEFYPLSLYIHPSHPISFILGWRTAASSGRAAATWRTLEAWASYGRGGCGCGRGGAGERRRNLNTYQRNASEWKPDYMDELLEALLGAVTAAKGEGETGQL